MKYWQNESLPPDLTETPLEKVEEFIVFLERGPFMIL
jgi:hypothetical protein